MTSEYSCDVESAGDGPDASASARAHADGSPPRTADASRPSMADTQKNRCLWCGEPCRDKYCGHNHRQRAYMSRKLSIIEDVNDTPKRLVYFDPPYPGLSAKYYGDQPTFEGEVDHEHLIRVVAPQYDGWALSTSKDGLRLCLPWCPSDIVICTWVKTHPPNSKSRGPGNITEFVLVLPARRRIWSPPVPDALVTAVARHGGTLPGRKPQKFVHWMFRLLGALPCDTLEDAYPGTGIVGRCWSHFANRTM